MLRFFIVPLLLALQAQPPSPLPGIDYYGRLKIGDNIFPLYLNLSKPALAVISIRGNDIPLKSFTFKKDSLYFERADLSARFMGHYNEHTRNIVGRWIADNRSHPLTFIPALADTIVGLHPRTSKSYRYQPPPKENDDIAICLRDDQRLNSDRLYSLVHAIISEKYQYVHSLLVARNNCLVLEEYFYNFRCEAHFGIQSASKSFVSALTGIALAKGEIKSVQSPLCDYLPKYKDLACNDQNKSITLDQVLSMSTGLEWDEISYDYGHEKNTSMIAAQQPDQFRYLLTRPRATEKVFAYNSLNHLMMNQVLRRATRMDNRKEMQHRLLKPLGITNYDLGKPEQGVIGDIFLRPRDMLKFGLLYLNEGNWKGNQIIPTSWVRESTATKIELAPGFGYAYFWWTKQFPWQGKIVDSYFAWGYGGQYIFVVPEIKLVVVFNGTNWSTDPATYYFEIMEQFILPACES